MKIMAEKYSWEFSSITSLIWLNSFFDLTIVKMVGNDTYPPVLTFGSTEYC